MLLTNIPAKVKWNGNNKKYYTDLGYEFTKLHEYFDVNPLHLPANNKSKVHCECDRCHEVYTTRYDIYLTRPQEETYCLNCKQVQSNKTMILKKVKDGSMSFKGWCLKNDRQDLLHRWNYELNEYQPEQIYYGSFEEYWFNCEHNNQHNPEKFRISALTNMCKESFATTCRQCNSFEQWCLDNNHEDYLKMWSNDLNSIKPIEITFGSHIDCYFDCDICGKSFTINPNKATSSGICCPFCTESMSGGELWILHFLEANNIKLKSQKTYSNLFGINGGHLSYDFYLPDYNMLIEFQGRQHEEPIEYFGGKEQFEKQQEHDRRKCQYAADHNIKLLEIWYYDFDNIEQILTEALGLDSTPLPKMLPRYRTNEANCA